MTLKADSFHTNTFKFYLGDSLRSKQVHVRDDAIFPFVDELFWGKQLKEQGHDQSMTFVCLSDSKQLGKQVMVVYWPKWPSGLSC